MSHVVTPISTHLTVMHRHICQTIQIKEIVEQFLLLTHSIKIATKDAIGCPVSRNSFYATLAIKITQQFPLSEQET